jgi:hypothetical protein
MFIRIGKSHDLLTAWTHLGSEKKHGENLKTGKYGNILIVWQSSLRTFINIPHGKI